MLRPIEEQVVVITGASSGIGREAAVRFAARGARVVLAARNQEALAELTWEIESTGGTALPVPVDVSDWDEVERLAELAAGRFGGIDTWVNNAGVAVYGTFADTPAREFKRVVDVNLMGQVYGAKAALPYLCQGGGGALIGIVSALGYFPLPLQSAYGTSKSGLVAFYRTLRLEQTYEGTGVQVSTITPASIDTLLFKHATTHLGVEPGPVGRVYSAGVVADAILYAASHPARDITVSAALAAGLALERLAPRLLEPAIQLVGFAAQRTTTPKPASGSTNLWQPVPGRGSVGGGYRSASSDPYSWLQRHPPLYDVLRGVALAALAVPLAALAAWVRSCPDVD